MKFKKAIKKVEKKLGKKELSIETLEKSEGKIVIADKNEDNRTFAYDAENEVYIISKNGQEVKFAKDEWDIIKKAFDLVDNKYQAKVAEEKAEELMQDVPVFSWSNASSEDQEEDEEEEEETPDLADDNNDIWSDPILEE